MQARLDKTLKKWLLRVHIVQAEVRPGQRAAVAARQARDPGLRVASHDEVMKHMPPVALAPEAMHQRYGLAAPEDIDIHG